MKRQYYFPKLATDRPGWLLHFAGQLPEATAGLAISPEAVAAAVADAIYLAYICGVWLEQTRSFGTAATAAARSAEREAREEPLELPVFTPPALPEGVVPVPPGILPRIFGFVQALKATPGYTDAIGLQLGIVGAEAATEHPVPVFTLRAERVATGEIVRVKFQRFGRPGVAIQGRRGGGEWEDLAISLKSPWLDRRPLLTAGQPEVREYRLQYYGDHAPTGDFTPIASVTVTP